MSTTESSGAPAESAATTPAPAAEFPTFGTTRGSGLARGKRSNAATTATTTPAADYKPTAIEVVSAPREYINPFAPAGEPTVAATSTTEPSTPAAAPAETPTGIEPAVETPATAPAPVESAQLNILPPAEQRATPAQTWESDGFSPSRAPRPETQAEEIDPASIPPQFLYVRPGVKFVPTPKNWGGAPRERKPAADTVAKPESVSASTPRAESPAPAKSGGFLGWLKGLFGGQSATESVSAGAGESRREGGHRRHRGGRGRGAEGGGQRRYRGGRGRNRSYGGDSEGTRSSGSL